MDYKYVESFIEHNRVLFFCIVAGLVAFSTNLTTQLFDSNSLFHEGEYVGLLYGMRAYYAGQTTFPLLIHGAMDYIPSILAAFIYGDNHVIVGTRVINTLIVWICWVLFLDISYLLIAKTMSRKFWLFIALVIFIVVTPPLFSSALIVEQAFIGTRDLFIILTIWSFFKYSYPENTLFAKSYLIIGTVSAVTAIFWSYDRGVMSLTFFAAMLLGTLINRKISHTLISSVIAALTILFFDYSNIFGSFLGNLDNVFYWVRHAAEIWGRSFNEFPISMNLRIFNLVAFCLCIIGVVASIEINKESKQYIFILVGLALIQLLLLKTALNRPGVTRLSWALWPALLMLFYAGSRLFPTLKLNFKMENNPELKLDSPSKIKTKYMYVAASLLLFLYLKPSLFPYASFVKNAFKPKLNAEVVSKEVINISSSLQQHGVQCVFGWMNEGVIGLVTGKRFCTSYPYAIYVSQSEEEKLLEQIKIESPSAIAFNPEAWAMNIDRSMATRLPNVHKYIEDNYPNKQKIDGYWIVSK